MQKVETIASTSGLSAGSNVQWSGKKVLVTGAGGFIASHLVEKLLALGAHVTALIRYNSRNDAGFLELLGDKRQDVSIACGDIRDLAAVRTLAQGNEIIFHLAALGGI